MVEDIPSGKMLVEVAYALPQRQVIIPFIVDTGTNAEAAIRASGIMLEFPQINLGVDTIGIFGSIIPLDTVLQHKDRVEIYRPLIANPKEMRRERAAQSKAKRLGNKHA